MKSDLFTDFYEAWNFLVDHPMFQDKQHINLFSGCVDINVVKVNPATEQIDDKADLNTATRVWLEAGPYEYGYVQDNQEEGCYSHDIELDCSGITFEEAIIELANLVVNKYGTYELEEISDTELNILKEKILKRKY